MRVFLCILTIVVLFSCSDDSSGSIFSVATYNAYALFDNVSDGDEFTGFSKNSGYTNAVYEERMKNIASMLGKYVNTDVIILEEVESEIVLESLMSSGLSKRGYRYYAIAGDDTINVALISKLMPLNVRIHKYGDERAILEAVFSFGGEIIHIFGVHLRSRLDDDNEEMRYEQLSHIKSLVSLNEDFNIVVGDFNIDPRYGESGMAEYPVSDWLTIPLPVTGDPGKIKGHIMYSAFLDSDLDVHYENGTYYYDNEWFFYDNILLPYEAFDGRGVEFMSQEIVSPAEICDLYNRPLKFDSSTVTGYSDHFPVVLYLKR